MKKIMLALMISCLSFTLMGCYYGTSESWEGGFAEDETSKKKDDGKFLFRYKNGSNVTFKELEISIDDKTLFEKKNYKKNEFSVPMKKAKEFTKDDKINVDIEWTIKGKEYKETLELELQ